MKKALMLIVALQFCFIVMAQGNSESSRKFLKGLNGVSVQTDLPSDAVQIGLLESQVRTDVELRLRLAGIKVLTEEERLTTPGDPVLMVDVVLYKMKIPGENYSYFFDVRLSQWVKLVRDPTAIGPATTWSLGAEGVFSSSGGILIRNQIKDVVDQFVNAYLSVNPKK